MNLDIIKSVDGLPEAEHDMLLDLLSVWSDKLARNMVRKKYYDGKNVLKDLKIAIPPQLTNIETVVGWPAKAVDALSVRSRFEGFVTPNGDTALSDVVNRNRLKIMYQQAVSSELISSCSFMTVSLGDESKGEPPVIISAYSAENAAALWDYRKKRIRCGMAVIDIDDRPHREPTPSWVNLYTDTAVWEIKKDGDRWTCRKNPHSMGMCTMVPLTYRPTLDRPFGKSRISRAVISITDSAVRTALRSEIGAEFYTAPQKYVLGADPTMFDDTSKWEAYIGSVWAITKDEDGDIPRFGQLSQASMQPHTEYMRSLAARFSGETGIPVSELGIIHDNPASAQAIYASKESLVVEAESLNEVNGEALRSIGMMAMAMEQGKALDELDEELAAVSPRFKNPAMPSIVSQADAIVKIISAMPFIAESRVALEEFGFTEDQIERIEADKAKAIRQQTLLQMMESGMGGE